MNTFCTCGSYAFSQDDAKKKSVSDCIFPNFPGIISTGRLPAQKCAFCTWFNDQRERYADASSQMRRIREKRKHQMERTHPEPIRDVDKQIKRLVKECMEWEERTKRRLGDESGHRDEQNHCPSRAYSEFKEKCETFIRYRTKLVFLDKRMELHRQTPAYHEEESTLEFCVSETARIRDDISQSLKTAIQRNTVAE